MVQPRFDKLVVVIAEGVAGDLSMEGALIFGRRPERDVIVHRDTDHAGGAGDVGGGIGALVEAVGQPIHRAGLAVVEPVAEVIAISRRRGRGDADEVEAEVTRPLLDLRRKLVGIDGFARGGRKLLCIRERRHWVVPS